MNKPKETQQDRKNGWSIANLLRGNVFTRQEIVKQLPFLLFLSFLALIYIANGYMAEGAVREINKIGNDLKELRSEYITTKSDLMYQSKQSELARTIEKKGLGLKESFVPPKKIIVQQNEEQLLTAATK